MDFAALEMREKVDLVKGALPDDATQPIVMKIDPNAMPIVQIAISMMEILRVYRHWQRILFNRDLKD